MRGNFYSFFTPIIFLTFASILISCGKLEPGQKKTMQIENLDRSHPALFFSGTNQFFESSSLLGLDLETLEIKKILDGQSGDVFVESDQNRLFVINRVAAIHNLRVLNWNENGDLDIGKQISLADLRAGDPHDLLVLDEQRILLANFVEGSLIVLDLESGEIIQRMDAKEFDLETKSFRPETLHRLSATEFLIVHQGLDIYFKPNQSQGLFIVEWKDGVLRRADFSSLHHSYAGIGKISVYSSTPLLFSDRSSPGKLILLGLCALDDPSCTSALERYDLSQPNDRSIKIFEPGQRPLFFGSACGLLGENKLFANSLLNGKKSVVSFDVESGEFESFYDYGEALEKGYWNLSCHEMLSSLFVGDATSSSLGRYLWFQGPVLKNEISLDVIPYSSSFIESKFSF